MKKANVVVVAGPNAVLASHMVLARMKEPPLIIVDAQDRCGPRQVDASGTPIVVKPIFLGEIK